MTEVDWFAGTDPQGMLEHLEGKASQRKLRLFACACCRQNPVWCYLTEPESRNAVEASEQFAEGLVTRDQLTAAMLLAPPGHRTGGGTNPRRLSLASQALRAALATTRADSWQAAMETLRLTMNLLDSAQGPLLLESFGVLPFRPALIDPVVLRWNDGTIPKLAQVIYDEQAFDRMPILADALQDAGCDDEELVSHFLGTGPHCRGCWALDAVLNLVGQAMRQAGV
jgi:hypothetical protein